MHKPCIHSATKQCPNGIKQNKNEHTLGEGLTLLPRTPAPLPKTVQENEIKNKSKHKKCLIVQHSGTHAPFQKTSLH